MTNIIDFETEKECAKVRVENKKKPKTITFEFNPLDNVDWDEVFKIAFENKT